MEGGQQKNAELLLCPISTMENFGLLNLPNNAAYVYI
jgi:hypothetical protein